MLETRVKTQLDSILDGRNSPILPYKDSIELLVGDGFSDSSSIRHSGCILNELKTRYEAMPKVQRRNGADAAAPDGGPERVKRQSSILAAFGERLAVRARSKHRRGKPSGRRDAGLKRHPCRGHMRIRSPALHGAQDGQH